MRLSKKFILVFAVFSLLAVPLLAQSRRTFYTFEIIVPEEINANPGDTVTVEGGIMVTGMYWLHNFDLNVSGLDYDYEISPEWFEHVRILRDWNPDDGLYRVPEEFELTIDVPMDASGAHVVTISGQEDHSFRQVSNETYFVLTIGGAPSTVNVSISDILLPEMINEDEPFNLTFKVDNNGAIDTAITVSIVIPDDWQVDEPSKTLVVEGETSELGTFTIIPTGNAGQVSLFAEYPFKGEIINFTKVGPYLVPGEEITTTTTQPGPFYMPLANFVNSIASPIVDALESALGDYAVPVMIGIIIILVIVIIWILSGMVRFVKTGRGEPETMKSQVKTSTISEAFDGIDQM